MKVKFYKIEDDGNVLLTDWQKAAVIVETEKAVTVYTTIKTARGEVKCFLRSMRDSTFCTWDTFGDSFGNPEAALDALMNARNPNSAYIAQQLVARDLVHHVAH